MKRWAENPWVWPVNVMIVFLAMLATPFTLAWHSLRSKKVSFIDGDLVLGNSKVEVGQIEYVLIHAYWPGPSFALTVRGHRPLGIIPFRDTDLYSWIKGKKVCVQIEGPREQEFRRRLGLPPTSANPNERRG